MARKRESPEIDTEAREDGVHAITGVPTSITAFVGRARRGPVDEPVPISSFVAFETLFGGLWSESTLGHSVRDFFRLGGSTAIVVRVHEPTPQDTASIVLGTGPSQLTLEAAAPGAWGSQLSAVISDDGTRRADPTTFNLTVFDGETDRVETFRDVSIAPGSLRRVDAVLEQQSRLARLPGLLPSTASEAYPISASATGGNDGGPVAAGNYIGGELRRHHRGLYALDGAGLINLIVIPPYTPSGDVEPPVIVKAVEYAEERGAVVIMDPPTPWNSVAAASAGASDPGFPASSHLAVYFPRIRQPDPLRNGQLATVAPSGAIAGVIARLDAGLGVWKAPAGPAAGVDGIAELSVFFDRDQIDELSLLGINCFHVIPGGGYFLWGARTRHPEEWKYLSVRRTALFIEESLRRGTEWAVYEPNGEALWADLRDSADEFLDDLFREGAFAGKTPEEAYYIRCDGTTTSKQDIDDGVVNLVVGFAPLKPAEFVVVEIQQRAGEPKRIVGRRRGRKKGRDED